MTLKILHTADLHIGLKFTRAYDPNVREKLIKARLDTLLRLVGIGNQKDCDLFVIAGDLFDSTHVGKKDILRVERIINDFEGMVAVLPGNHDYVQSDSKGLWDIFAEESDENVLLLLNPEYVEIELGDYKVGLYPGPCISKHSSKSAVGWVNKKKKKEEVDFHIGIAHGSLEGISPDFEKEYYPMTKEELNAAGCDLWLMGHTHVRVPDKKSGSGGGIFFASTPEPDGFDCHHEGYAWFYELDDKATIKYRSLQTGHFKFLSLEEKISSVQDVENLKAQFEKLDDGRHLVKLRVHGRIPKNLFGERQAEWKQLEENVLHLEVDDFDLLQRITKTDINTEFTDGSFPHELLTTLLDEKDNPLALQIGYELINEVRS